MTSVRNEKTTAFTPESCGIFKMDCLLEQLAASPDADTGADDRDDDLTHEAGSGQAHEAEEDAAHKAAQDASTMLRRALVSQPMMRPAMEPASAPMRRLKIKPNIRKTS